MSLIQWAKGQKARGSSSASSTSSTMNKNWIHTPEALLHGHIVYLVKLLGFTDVDKAKGTEVVKEAIRKIKFNNQIKKSEGTMTNKLPKVEFTVSADGVTVQDPKSKAISHQYPLHRMSYCADDKADKKIFSFIAKEPESDQHTCFVFVSDKCAEDITLTVGQAFDLAYRRFLDNNGKDMEMRKENMLLQKKVQKLESENKALKLRIVELEKNAGKEPVETLKQKSASFNATNTTPIDNGISVDSTPSPPPRQQKQRASTNPFQNDFNSVNIPTTAEANGAVSSPLTASAGDGQSIPTLSPPPSSTQTNAAKPVTSSVTGTGSRDLFGAEPFDPFSTPTFPAVGDGVKSGNSGSASPGNPFTTANSQQQNWTEQEWDKAIGNIDKQLNEIKEGFDRGLDIGNDDFNIEDLDPLNQKQVVT